MTSRDLSPELSFDLPEFEPGAVLLEQLSCLAAAPPTGAGTGRRLTRRAAAGVFAGLLLASGTAYAARDQIEPVFGAIVGPTHDHTPAVPPSHPSPTPSATDSTGSGGSEPPSVSTRTEGPSEQRSGGEDSQQSGSTSGGDGQTSAPSSGEQQSTGSGGDGSSSPSGTSSSGDGTSLSGDGSSVSGDGSSPGQ